MSEYKHYTNVNKDVLEVIKVGDLVKINDWKKPLRVNGVTENYFVMSRRIFGKSLYSVCSKLPWDGYRHNEMRGGMYHCGRDSWIFGAPDFDYNFSDTVQVNKYLMSFENGESQISERNGVPIYELFVKSE